MQIIFLRFFYLRSSPTYAPLGSTTVGGSIALRWAWGPSVCPSTIVIVLHGLGLLRAHCCLFLAGVGNQSRNDCGTISAGKRVCSLTFWSLLAKMRALTDYLKTRCSPLEVSLDLLAHFPIVARYLNCYQLRQSLLAGMRVALNNQFGRNHPKQFDTTSAS